MSTKQYGHGNTINLATAWKEKHYSAIAGEWLPKITDFVVDARLLDMYSLRKKLNTSFTGALMNMGTSPPERKSAGFPIYGIATTINHLHPDTENLGLIDIIREYGQDLTERGVDTHLLPHKAIKYKQTHDAQPYIFTPFMKVQTINGDPELSYLESTPEEMPILLDYLIEKGLIDPRDTEDKALIDKHFPLRARNLALQLEP